MRSLVINIFGMIISEKFKKVMVSMCLGGKWYCDNSDIFVYYILKK